MLFAIVSACLLLIVMAAVGMPLLSGSRAAFTRGFYDRAVYRDQLREVDRDLARAVLTPAEADSARLEIQRRLLASDTGASPSGRPGAADTRPAGVPPSASSAGWGGRNPLTAVMAMLFVVLAAGGLYWKLGAPMVPDSPFADRPPMPEEARGEPADGEAARAEMQAAAARLEQDLKADPSNTGAWMLYARTESLLGEWDKAADAFKHAMALGQNSGETLAGYGEVLVMAGDGVVSPAAREAFTQSLAKEPGNPAARYYLALADAQAGDLRKAVDAWLELAAALPEDAPMRAEIGRRVVAAAKTGGFAAPPFPKGLPPEASMPGPTPEQMAAAASMPPEERAKMINGMIEQLAARLRENPDNLEGWMRLGRAYFMQGESAKAVDAYDHALALRPDDPGIKLQTVAALMAGLHPGDAPPARAISLLNEVASVAPDAPEVLWYLGLIAAHDGRTDEARDKWTKLLASVPPGGPEEKMVRSVLGQLKGN